MTLLEKMKLRSFEKSLAINHHKTARGQSLNFDKIKNIIILVDKQSIDKEFRSFVTLLEKTTIVKILTLDKRKGDKEAIDTNLFNSSQITWGHLPPEFIVSKWQSYKTDMVINYFDESCKSLIYLSAIIDQTFSIGVFENKWLQNDITIQLKEKSSKEFSNMFFYLLKTTTLAV